jgi:hypothetical protein
MCGSSDSNALKKYLLACALSGAPDKMHYLDSEVIQSRSAKARQDGVQRGVSGPGTPDKSTGEYHSEQS